MSCCGGNCGCGSACKCGNGCGGCNMYPGLSYSEAAGAAAETVVLGVPPQRTRTFEGSEMAVAGSEYDGCKCGSNCTCSPCTCK
ncbi:Metallothionein-like protein 2B [Striga hermonthica]|uniref:Metallothionein-like protein n=1 Tax=Striga hermonthica TaxID=68872 RepID=A0A9N7NRU1_STRHE|nr:Metallothionein-like protein 2B [Striga hermonthica]